MSSNNQGHRSVGVLENDDEQVLPRKDHIAHASHTTELDMNTSRALAVVCATAVIGCVRSDSTADLSPADIAAIQATSARWETAVREWRWKDAAATFTHDAVLRFPDTAYHGRADILRYFEAQQPWPATRKLHIDEIQGRSQAHRILQCLPGA